MLIFLHGGPGFRDYLKPYFHELNDTFSCVFYDQLQGPQITVEDLLGQLKAIVGDSKPILIGHSWGGVLATEFATKNERKISGLVLISTGLSRAQWHKYRDDLEELHLADAPIEKIVLAPKDPPFAGDFLKNMDGTFSEETFDSLYEEYLNQFDLTGAVPSLTCRIVSIFGSEDLRFSPRIATEIQALNPRIKSHSIKGAGHFPFLQEKAKENIHRILRETFADC